MTEVTPAIDRLRRVAPLALIVVLLAACGDDNKSTATADDASERHDEDGRVNAYPHAEGSTGQYGQGNAPRQQARPDSASREEHRPLRPDPS